MLVVEKIMEEMRTRILAWEPRGRSEDLELVHEIGVHEKFILLLSPLESPFAV